MYSLSVTSAPKALLATTCRWFSAARLAAALQECGWKVEVLCPPGHPVTKLRTVPISYAFNGLRSMETIEQAIRAARADLIIPCDDLALRLLERLAERAAGRGNKEFSAVLNRCFGDAFTRRICGSRAGSLAAAAEAGVRTPETKVVRNLEEVRAWLDGSGVPAVLKVDGTSGGVGVRVVRTRDEAEWAFRKLDAPPLIARTVKRALIDRDLNLVLPCLRRQRSTVSIQKFIAGQDATCTVACWQGKLLACSSFLVLRTWEAKGPASVLQAIENGEMREAGRAIAGRLGLSGIYGFDFMLEERTGRAFLIEINARATQTAHLALGPGRDIPAALRAALTGEPVENRRRVSDNDVFALFPAEWQNDPGSAFLSCGYHDVPWGHPNLVKTGLMQRRDPAWKAALKLIRQKVKRQAGQVARDDRFGRADETAGESQFAGAAMKQGR